MFSRENRSGMGLVIGWWVLIVLLLIGGTFAYLLVLRPMMDLQTRANRGSFQYVDTKQRELLKWVADYEQLDADIAAAEGNVNLVEAKRSQQLVLLKRIKAEKALLAADQVPPDVNRFLAKH